MTVAWLMSESQDPRRASLDAPGTNARVVLEHTSGFEGLIRYPESAVRVALVHIFNETRNGGKARALADKKAIEALAKYVDYTRKQQPARGEEFKGYFQLAEWLLPWLWRRRGIDQLFVWKVTLNWLQQIFLGENERVEVKELHPAILLMEQHAELVFPVFDVSKARRRSKDSPRLTRFARIFFGLCSPRHQIHVKNRTWNCHHRIAGSFMRIF